MISSSASRGSSQFMNMFTSPAIALSSSVSAAVPGTLKTVSCPKAALASTMNVHLAGSSFQLRCMSYSPCMGRGSEAVISSR
eukprot:CAMPEP_0173372610 /NCGR_PEP_ID=MMETSP1144-20121109/28007_1 /TAXON_ID=483371 /ORGANISM="non described non described, Strain CCMP2298" /LENGTH=81 /DNA_ID=CAMNT_0014324631 /DNA_START=661 /DNA_END=906 /DNA_ORIENTATION=-